MSKPVVPLTVLALAALTSACAEPIAEDDTASRAAEASAPGHVSDYRHPLLNAPTLADGRVAVVDTVDSPKPDRRYAEIHSYSIAEDGTQTRSSGVVELRREFRSIKRARPKPALSPVVGPDLRQRADDLIAAGRGSETVAVNISLLRPNGSLTGELRQQVARGEIDSVAELHEHAADIKRTRAVEVRRAVDAAAAAISSLGGTPGYRCRNGYCLDAELPATLVDRVAALPGIQRLSVAFEMQPESTGGDAEDRSEVMQINQFLDDAYDGEQDPSTFRDDIVFAVIESDEYDDEHPAWDKAGVSWDRVMSGFNCTDGTGCTYTTNFGTPADDHPTKVAGLVFANLNDGQDPGLVDPERYSGFARNAQGRLFNADPDAWDEAIDEIRGITGPYEHVVNMSQGGTIACNGDEAAASAVNDLFEDGTLLFKSAGNKSFSTLDPDDCRVTTPGAAIGAFTVGAISSTLNVAGMREADIWYANSDVGSSTGGSEDTPLDGRGRTIIDLVAQTGVKFVPIPESDYESFFSAIGTSFAAPQVTGAAINFIDYFQDSHFNLEYEPGYLFVNLLLMGDRVACTDENAVCSTTELTTRFDRRFGAGRARFRRFDGPGMDSPYHYATGMIPCLSDSESVYLEVPTDNSYTLMESTVDDFKFVAWWYDRRHELTGTVANVDLRLFHVDAGGTEISTLLTSDDDYDNKERLYYNAPGSKRLVVEISGTDTVPADDSWNESGCTDGEVNVYFAYFAEDDARDDFDGPSWSSPNGVEPEDVVW